jgi:integrase
MAKKVRRTRRGNGEGSIYKASNGQWCGAISLGVDENGKNVRKYIYAATRAEVSRKIIDITGKIQNNTYTTKEERKIKDLMFEWLMVFKKSAVAPRTFEAHIRNFRLHIEPNIGNMDVKEVDTMTIQKLYNELFLKGLATVTIKKIKHILGQFFDYSIENGIIEKNPVTKTKLKNRDRKVYTNEERYKAIPKKARDEFLAMLNNHELLKPLCMTAMFGGLRIGELLALRWKNVDFKNKTINVERAITQLPKFNEEGEIVSRKTIISETKTACSIREVPIPDILVDALQDWKRIQWVKEQVYGYELIKPESIVFANNDGSHRTYSGTRMIMNRFLKRYNLEGYGIHFHTLRHTYSNMLFEMGENPKVIQMLLGHKDVKTTITTYNSVDKSYYRQATDKLNGLFNKKKNEDYNILKEKPDAPVYKQDDSEDLEIKALERLLAEKKARKEKDDFEM